MDTCNECGNAINFKDRFLDECGIDIKNLKKMSENQRKAIRESFGDNISCFGVEFDGENIVFTSKSTLKNWKYYAGLEYCDGASFQTLDFDGIFYTVYNEDAHSRIAEIISTLNDVSEEN